MFKNKVMTFILLTAVFVSGRAYCQQTSTVSGKVDTIDVEGGIINIKTDTGVMVFHISTESDLYRSTHHMASIEIVPGDPVIIQYVTASGQNNVVNLVDNAPPAVK